MNGENKDFIIKNLEKKLREKELEIEDMKKSIHDSLLDELRNDLDFDNRILKLENKVQELTNNYNGVMNELLDQKSLINLLSSKKNSEEKDFNSPIETERFIPNKNKDKKDNIQQIVNDLPVISSSFSIMPNDLKNIEFNEPSLNSKYNIREAVNSSSVPVSFNENKKTEYIIAENDDNYKNKNLDKKKISEYNCDFIVAKDDKLRKKVEFEERVESRDHEDVELTVMKRKDFLK